MLRTLAIVSASALVLAACESTTSLPYQASTQNVIAAQQALNETEAKVSVAPFSAASGVAKPTCRMAGQLDVAPGTDIQSYIRNAFEAEMFMADLLDANGTSIRGHIEDVQVSTFGTGSWTLVMSVSSDHLPEGYQVTSSHGFATSFSAYMACQNASVAFNSAVQALLSDVINHPSFSRLAGAQ